MKIAIHTPYGLMSEETGVIYLLGNYLKSIFDEVIQLRCNGIFSWCDKDAMSGWKRNLHNCAKCINEQRGLANWANLVEYDLSRFLHAAEIEDTRRWLDGLSFSDLAQANYKGIDIAGLCSGSFRNRFGVEQADAQNKNHEYWLRRLLLAAARMFLASARFNNYYKPNYTFVAGGWDFISRSYIAHAQMHALNMVLFKVDVGARCVQVYHPSNKNVLSVECVLHGVTSMRSDAKTWPAELIKIIEDILSFLDIAPGQLALPLAR